MNKEENTVQEVKTMPIKVDLTKLTETMTTVLATANPVINLTKTYLKLEEKKPARFLFTETTEVIDQETGELSQAIVLVNDKREMFITRSIILVNACKDLPAFAGVEIEYLGQKDLTGGKKLKQFRVSLLG